WPDTSVARRRAEVVPLSGAEGLRYVSLGNWVGGGTAGGGSPRITVPWAGYPHTMGENVTWFVFGYETPGMAMPASGTATFSVSAWGDVYAPVDGALSGAFLTGGRATFLADFGSGKITGSMTGFQPNYNSGGQVTPWNDISVN